MANTTGFRHTKSFNTIVDDADYCEHCTKEDLSKAVGYFYERDDSGLVFAHIVCEECRVSCETAAGEQDTTCVDCLQTVKVKDTIDWRWYDFCASSGDEPLIVCKCCQERDVHIARVERYDDAVIYEQRQDEEDEPEDEDDEDDDDALDEEEGDDIPDEHWDDLR